MGELEIFATRIKNLRVSLKMTQKDFSDHIGIKQQTLSGYERGLMKPPLDIAKSIAEKCNVSIDWLCGLTDEKNLKQEITSYKDVALKILELLNLNLFDGRFELKLLLEDDFPVHEYHLAIKLPNHPELLKFFETYKDLYKLYENGKIKQHVIETWLDGALEELSALSTQDPGISGGR